MLDSRFGSLGMDWSHSCVDMSDFDTESVRKYVFEYLDAQENIELIWFELIMYRVTSLKSVRKYVEKKMGVPRNALIERKKELKKICSV